ncbi:sigma factor-like helix-turn-helix DNA-binding protein [Actinoalloteichus caeruleus]|uniref:sigma factor-like helix-turn-helix DNA-binding protein n=1 Tax=Actinoalloteichus cyanogriseus TaxID=2893586 RepID=UPI0009DDACA7|nr:sigma factor-like helix-turn-helix DNA-binding protein [Actinoalloteichus caeruleus]
MDQNPSWSGPTRSRARATLPPRQRAVIVLRFSEDLTEERTATALWASRGTVTEPDRAGTRPAARRPAPGRGRPRREGPPSPPLPPARRGERPRVPVGGDTPWPLGNRGGYWPPPAPTAHSHPASGRGRVAEAGQRNAASSTAGSPTVPVTRPRRRRRR